MSPRSSPPSAPAGSAPRFTALLYFASRAALPIAVAAYAWFYQGAWKEHWPVAAILTGCLLILFQWSARVTARPRCPVCREGVLHRTAKLHPHARKWLGISASAPAAWEILTSDSHQCMHCHSRCRNQRTGLAINTPPPALALSPWDPRSGSSVFDPVPSTPRATLLPLGALFQDSAPAEAAAGPISRQALSEEWEPPPPALESPTKRAASAFWEKAAQSAPSPAPAPVAQHAVSIPAGPNPFLSRIPERAKPVSDSPFSLLKPAAAPDPPSEPVAAAPHVRSPFTAVSPAFPAPPQSLPQPFPSFSPPLTPRAISMESNDFPFPAMPVTPPPAPNAAPIADLPAGDPPSLATPVGKLPFPTAAPRVLPVAAEPTAEMLRGLLEIMRDGRRALDGAFDQMLARLERVLDETPAAAPAPAAEAWPSPSPSPAFPAPAADVAAPEWTAPPKPLDFTAPAVVAPPQPPAAFPLPEGKTAPFPAPLPPLFSDNVANDTASPLPPTTASEPVDFPLPPLIPLAPPVSPPPRPVAAPAAPANWFPIPSVAPAAAAETPVAPLVPEKPLAARPDTAPLPLPLPFPPALPDDEDDWNPPVATAPAPPANPLPLSPLPPFGAPAAPEASPPPRLRRIPALDPLTAQELSHTLANAFTSRPPSASPTARPAGESPFEFLGGSSSDDAWPELPDSPWNHPRGGHTPPQS